MAIVKQISGQAARAVPRLTADGAKAMQALMRGIGDDIATPARQLARDGVARHLRAVDRLETSLGQFQKSRSREIARGASQTLDAGLFTLRKGMQVGKNAHDLGLKTAIKAGNNLIDTQVFLGEKRHELGMLLLDPARRRSVDRIYNAGLKRHNGSLKQLDKFIVDRVDDVVTAGMKRHSTAVRAATPGWRKQFKAWVADGAERHATAIGADSAISRLMRQLVR
ncbi:MAG: hypothetical protein VKP72_10810 [bacterium]|nr:hypothetical protein [bacterium]